MNDVGTWSVWQHSKQHIKRNQVFRSVPKDNRFYISIQDPKKYCGGRLNQTSGWLSTLDRDGDSMYDANLDCSWVIEAKRFNIIIVRFLYFDVDGTRACKDDYVEVGKTKTQY